MNPLKYQEIIDAAIQNEIEARDFYLQVADKTDNSYLKGMFLDFAAEELKHRKILEEFQADDTKAMHFARVPDFHVSETVEEPRLTIDMKPADAIALAMKKEESAMQHYTQLAEVCEDAGQQQIFFELAAMERQHKTRLESAFVDIGYPEVW